MRASSSRFSSISQLHRRPQQRGHTAGRIGQHATDLLDTQSTTLADRRPPPARVMPNSRQKPRSVLKRAVRVAIQALRDRCRACSACCSTDFTHTGTMSSSRSACSSERRLRRWSCCASHRRPRSAPAAAGPRAHRCQPATPVVGTATGFHDQRADVAIGEPALELAASQPCASSDARVLEHALGQIHSHHNKQQ